MHKFMLQNLPILSKVSQVQLYERQEGHEDDIAKFNNIF